MMLYVLIGLAWFIVGWISCTLFASGDDGGNF